MSGGAQYESIAEEFLEHATDAPYNAHYDRPAVLRLLGDVAGMRLLDAACGPGLYAQELAAAGADVVGVDNSPGMIELARALVPGAQFHVHDLDEPLIWVPDGSFDVVLSALALHYFRDPTATLREFHRVLRSGGRAVISSSHPTSDWLRLSGSYFDVESVTETWSRGWEIGAWRAPLQFWFDAFADAGFLVERFVEPRPADSMKVTYPEDFDKLNRQPGFYAVKLLKP